MEMFSKGSQHSKGALTGVELANIAIAVIIASSVLAFVVANMGSLLTGEVRETITSSLSQAKSVMIAQGHVIAHGDPVTQRVTAIRFYVRLIAGGKPIDFNESRMIISYSNSRIHVANTYGIGGPSFWANISEAEKHFKSKGGSWCIVAVIKGDEDAILEEGEIFMILVNLRAIGEEAMLKPYEQFTIEVKPPIGVPLTIKRKTPAVIDPLMDLG